MARKKKSNSERIMEKIKKLIPDGMIPDSYLEYVIEENREFSESEAEWLSEIKMQLFEESGIDFPMTRKEAESFLADDMADEQWNALTQSGTVPASQVKMLDDSFDKTMLDMIREIPLIPASRLISTFVIGYLRRFGQEVTPEMEEQIADEMIHSLNASFSDMAMMMQEEMDLGDEFGPDFDLEDLPFGSSEPDNPDPEPSRRRGRITRFPGKM